MKKVILAAALVLPTTVLASDVIYPETKMEKEKAITWATAYGDYVADIGSGNESEPKAILGVEGGFKKGIFDIYGFAEQDMTNHTHFQKITGHVSVMNGFTGYGQITYFSAGSDDYKGILGVGYEDFQYIKPFVGVHYNHNEDESNVAFGYTGNLPITNRMHVGTWHETVMGRGENATSQGDVGVYYKANGKFTVGVKYIYNYNPDVKYTDSIGFRASYSL